jgi:hypothetical protein
MEMDHGNLCLYSKSFLLVHLLYSKQAADISMEFYRHYNICTARPSRTAFILALWLTRLTFSIRYTWKECSGWDGNAIFFSGEFRS